MTAFLDDIATLAPFAGVVLVIYLSLGIAGALVVGILCECFAEPDPWEEAGRRGREEGHKS